jgi:hypothetical protein
MAILVSITLPVGVTLEMTDELVAEMNVVADPPAGLIVHAGYGEGERARAVDVWESKDAFDQFGQSRLGPAIAKVASAHGVDASQPEMTMVELHEVIRGR